MPSQTANKKEIIDFLWEWAESHGDWGKLIIDKIVRTEEHLSVNDREEIFNYFLQSIGLFSQLPQITITKPQYNPTSKIIELISLSGITGVNKLAKNQKIDFYKNITIVYGENATGKTGYSRILKSLGYSYDENNSIYPNIYENVEPKSATIHYRSNNIDKPPFLWSGNNKNSELENISVFNSSCVQLSLSDDRKLIVSPIGFHLFKLVSEELNELENLLQEKISRHSTKLSLADTLNEGTPQQIFISGLSDNSTEEKLNELSSFTLMQEQELKEKEIDLSNLNKTLLQNDIQNLIAQDNELNALIIKIQTAQSVLSTNNWQKLIDLNKQIINLKSKTQKGIKEIADSKGIEYYGTKEFQKFIQSAEDYIKILNRPEYPEKDDLCIYCKQPLEISATELLKSYRALLNNKTQESIQQLNKQKTSLIDQVSQVDINLYLHQSTFGVDSNQKPIQPNEIAEYNKNLGLLKTNFCTDKVTPDSTFTFDYDIPVQFLFNEKTRINSSIIVKKNLLSNLATKEIELKSKIAELKDRKSLSIRQSEIKTVISNNKIIAKLKSKAAVFNTLSISHKTSQARDILIEQNFNRIFQEELNALRKSSIKIDLSFATEKGKSRVSQKIAKHLLSDILSEGEQKAIALAEFLTELQLDNIKAPVIFDDPVNSLDHRIINEVSKRLIELSKQRQVIVFTHSILLLNSFIQQRELETNKTIQSNFLSVINNYGETGIISDVEEMNSYNYYIKKLEAVLATKSNGQNEIKLAQEGYGHLRSAIEIVVEENILKKIIKRYRKGVAFPSLLRIDGKKIDELKGKLNDVYEKCCDSIVCHSNVTESCTTPTIEELKIDFDEMKKIRKQFL